ncbi:twin-arginine translocation pathway signal [Mycobacterium spongiae]|uniref:Twin-arginine translocation pathway signal n=2 Tax=Mycobacterium spongiae TaxID=886343 RepID=A0A975K234_9MYCO|nr:twin-arginine translocation pathway signal [Mycobacterium spongiae]
MVAWRPIALTALVVGSLGLVSCMYLFRYSPDRQVADVAAQQAIQAASDGATALLSYSPESLDRDFANARSHLTGGILEYYTKLTEQTVAPTATRQHIVMNTKVIRAAVSELHRNSAVVLVFLSQTTMSKDKPDPTTTSSSVLVTLTKVKGSWLITKFDRL